MSHSHNYAHKHTDKGMYCCTQTRSFGLSHIHTYVHKHTTKTSIAAHKHTAIQTQPWNGAAWGAGIDHRG